MSVHTTSARTGTGRDDWRTPTTLLRAIERRTGLRLVLDTACEAATAIDGVRASCATDRGCDGLTADWAVAMDVTRTAAPSNREAAWCNPPYSQLRPWLRKCASEGARVPVVALIPPAPQQRQRLPPLPATRRRPAHRQLPGSGGC
jgi:hypothetical protein